VRERLLLIDAAVFVERLLPETFRDLDEVLRLTPTASLAGVDQSLLDAEPSNNIHEGVGVRVRVGLLLGLVGR